MLKLLEKRNIKLKRSSFPWLTSVKSKPRQGKTEVPYSEIDDFPTVDGCVRLWPWPGENKDDISHEPRTDYEMKYPKVPLTIKWFDTMIFFIKHMKEHPFKFSTIHPYEFCTEECISMIPLMLMPKTLLEQEFYMHTIHEYIRHKNVIERMLDVFYRIHPAFKNRDRIMDLALLYTIIFRLTENNGSNALAIFKSVPLAKFVPLLKHLKNRSLRLKMCKIAATHYSTDYLRAIFSFDKLFLHKYLQDLFIIFEKEIIQKAGIIYKRPWVLTRGKFKHFKAMRPPSKISLPIKRVVPKRARPVPSSHYLTPPTLNLSFRFGAYHRSKLRGSLSKQNKELMKTESQKSVKVLKSDFSLKSRVSKKSDMTQKKKAISKKSDIIDNKSISCISSGYTPYSTEHKKSKKNITIADIKASKSQQKFNQTTDSEKSSKSKREVDLADGLRKEKIHSHKYFGKLTTASAKEEHASTTNVSSEPDFSSHKEYQIFKFVEPEIPMYSMKPHKTDHQAPHISSNKKNLEKSLTSKKLGEISQNNATVLRDASILAKEKEEQIQRIADLISASQSFLDYELVLEKYRQMEEEEEILDIERKHLSGKLTREEAILAKQNLILKNAEKRRQFEMEKKELDERLEELRSKELMYAQTLVNETREIHWKIKDKQCNILEEKKRIAQERSRQKELNAKRIYEKKKLELEKKIDLVRQFKAFQLVSKENLELHKLKVSNLYNMSSDELKTKVDLYKRFLRDDLRKRHSLIIGKKEQRQALVNAAKGFVQEMRQCKKCIRDEQPRPKNISNRGTHKGVKDTKDILDLKTKFEQAKIQQAKNLEILRSMKKRNI